MAHKKTILKYSDELKIILRKIDNNGTFTSSIVGIDGNTLGRMVKQKIIAIAGFDRRHQRHIYKISIHQRVIIDNIIGE